MDLISTTEPAKQPAKIPPETPVPPYIDIFSPTASEPSAVRPESRDTPPPSDLKPDTAHVAAFGDAGRTTRRPRSSVSYTEPNLRHKMRRPTKDLVDAVGTDERAQQVSVKQNEDANLSQEEKTYRTIVVKTEEIVKSVDPWKISSVKEAQYQHPHFRDEAVSPLGNTTSTDLSTSIFTERRRHSNSIQHDDENTNNLAKPPSGARSTIAALARSQKPKSHNEGTKLPDEPELQDIFELNRSSPTEPGPIARDGNQDPSAVVKSRRYSTVPAEEHKKEKRSTSSTMVAKREKRRETLLNSAVSTTSTVADANMDANNKPVSELRSVKSVIKMQGGLDGAAGRAERVASRRRSMML